MRREERDPVLDMLERFSENSLKQTLMLRETLEIMAFDRKRIAALEAQVDSERRQYGSRENPLLTRPRTWAWGLRRT